MRSILESGPWLGCRSTPLRARDVVHLPRRGQCLHTRSTMSTDPDTTSAPWHHSHAFHSASEAAQRSTMLVFWITAFAMVAEIVAGYWFNSMALLADGWHMSSHALAIGLAVFAYATARRYKDDERFAFGTWKVEVLAGFTSAILLLVVAALMLFGSLERLL